MRQLTLNLTCVERFRETQKYKSRAAYLVYCFLFNPSYLGAPFWIYIYIHGSSLRLRYFIYIYIYIYMAQALGCGTIYMWLKPEAAVLYNTNMHSICCLLWSMGCDCDCMWLRLMLRLTHIRSARSGFGGMSVLPLAVLNAGVWPSPGICTGRRLRMYSGWRKNEHGSTTTGSSGVSLNLINICGFLLSS